MRLKYITLCLTALVLALTGCKSDKKTGEVNEKGLPVFEFNNEDSVAVRQLADEYVQRFQSKDFEACADMLYTVKNDSVHPLTKEQRQGYVNAMQHLPFQGIAVKEQKLLSDKDNEVRIALLMSPDGDLETERGTVNFVLNPVYIGEKWYLTLRDEYAEGVGLYH